MKLVMWIFCERKLMVKCLFFWVWVSLVCIWYDRLLVVKMEIRIVVMIKFKVRVIISLIIVKLCWEGGEEGKWEVKD